MNYLFLFNTIRMKSYLSFCTVIAFLLSGAIQLSAQTSGSNKGATQYNTKRNIIFLNGSIGGGDYPFAGLGLTLSRQFYDGNTLAGISFQYIGNTWDGSDIGGIDPVQIFPLMLDVRQQFTGTRDGRFSTFLIATGGYVISITGNGMNEFGPFEFKNGWAINPGIGFRFNVFENLGLMLDLTWLHHAQGREWLDPVVRKDVKHWNVGLVRGNIFF